MRYYQQGDVLLKPVNFPLPKEIKKINSLILAEGEKTGHKHEVIGEAEIYQAKDGNMFLSVIDDQVIVTHQEHKPPLTIPKGDYVIQIVREYDHFEEEAKKVVD